MAGFHYQALDANGQPQEGVVEADNPRSARAALRDRQLWVTTLEEVGAGLGKKTSALGGLRRQGISGADLALLTRQTAVLLGAGLTLERALTVLIEQSEEVKVRNVVAALRSEVLGGSPLSVAMAHYPKIFNELYRTIVRAGEESGRAAAVMSRLADYIEARQALNSKIALAFVYPLVVLSVSLLVILGLLYWVVPQMVAIFQSSHQVLPLLTRALLAISAGVRSGGWLVALLLVGAGYGFRRMMRRDAFAIAVHAWLLRAPLWGRLNRSAQTARFASTLAILVSSGVPLLRAISAAVGVVSNRFLREAVQAALRDVREGATLSRALELQKCFPPVLIHLIHSGEVSGTLGEMLGRVAQQQTGELEQRVSTLTSLLAPGMVLLMGGAVLLIVLAILLPIFEMNQFVR